MTDYDDAATVSTSEPCARCAELAEIIELLRDAVTECNTRFRVLADELARGKP